MDITPPVSGKRYRTAFTTAQIEFLRKAYEDNEYPNSSEYSQLGKDAGLTASVVRTWFCNTRASRRKNFKPRFKINNEDQEFLSYLIRNQPQILPYFSVSSNFAVGQPQQVGFDPLLAFRQSTGGAYHALCDAIGIDRIDPQQSMPSATSGNLTDLDDLLDILSSDQ